MLLNLLATIWSKHKIEMQIICDGTEVHTGLGIRVSGPEYRKIEDRETLRWGCCCKKRENRFVSKRWHPSYKCARDPRSVDNEWSFSVVYICFVFCFVFVRGLVNPIRCRYLSHYIVETIRNVLVFKSRL